VYLIYKFNLDGVEGLFAVSHRIPQIQKSSGEGKFGSEGFQGSFHIVFSATWTPSESLRVTDARPEVCVDKEKIHG